MRWKRAWNMFVYFISNDVETVNNNGFFLERCLYGKVCGKMLYENIVSEVNKDAFKGWWKLAFVGSQQCA